jgi:hypothetical protein
MTPEEKKILDDHVARNTPLDLSGRSTPAEAAVELRVKKAYLTGYKYCLVDVQNAFNAAMKTLSEATENNLKEASGS